VDVPGYPDALWTVLTEAAAGERVALVGGAVRDLLLHRDHRDPWRGLPDLDLVVEGSIDHFVERLSHGAGVELRAQRVHGAYGTVELELGIAGMDLQLDVATARAETYPVPAGKPVVGFACLDQDLARRDFSVNAIAIVLGAPEGSPAVLDPHGGQRDLRRRELRFLHEGSFRDDPSRLVRAARYAARLGFSLASEARNQVLSTLADNPWHSDRALPGLSTRLRMEFELLLEREPWAEALRLLQSWGGFCLLDATLQADHHWRRRLHWAKRFALSPLAALLAGCADPVLIAHRLQLPQREIRALGAFLVLRQRLDTLSVLPQSPSQWAEFLESSGCTADAVALCLATGDCPRRPLLRWWLRWRHQRAPITAAELMEKEGLAPGPGLGARLRILRGQWLDAQEAVR
jgi:poly(A) polymerase